MVWGYLHTLTYVGYALTYPPILASLGVSLFSVRIFFSYSNSTNKFQLFHLTDSSWDVLWKSSNQLSIIIIIIILLFYNLHKAPRNSGRCYYFGVGPFPLAYVPALGCASEQKKFKIFGAYLLSRPHSRSEVRLIIMKFTKIWWEYNALVTKLWELQQRSMDSRPPRTHYIKYFT